MKTENITSIGKVGYWSNLDKDEGRYLSDLAEKIGPREAVRMHFPHLFEVIFSPKRQAGLELLDLSGDESCIDFGCMWGALTIPLAKRCRHVKAIDQTLDSLRFLHTRAKEEKLDNIELLCGNLKDINNFIGGFDVAIVNGVLEWIPEEGEIELKNYYGQYLNKQYKGNPGKDQLAFLETIYRNLNQNGRLYLTLENRFDFKMFFGGREPHTGLLFASILPRKLANWLSRLRLGRPYINWTYSFPGVRALLEKAGFSKIELYMCFPDYRFPERIKPYQGTLKDFSPTIALKNDRGQRPLKRFLARIGEFIIFRVLRIKYLAPSIIAIGYK